MHTQEKGILDEAVRAITVDPQIVQMKKGDPAGVRVYKYRSQTGLLLIADRVVQDEEMIKLPAVGLHENFYRDLKRE